MLNICDTDATEYQLEGKVSSGYAQPAYQWQVALDTGNWLDIPVETSTVYRRKHTGKGTYRYRLTVAESGNISKSTCRVVSNIVSVTVNEKPVVKARANNPVCDGEQVLLQTDRFPTVSWTGPNGFNSNANAQFTASKASSGKYHVIVTSEAGCTNIDSVELVVNERPDAAVSAGVIICEGRSTQLSASGGTSYQWTPVTGLSAANISNPTASPPRTTTYFLRAKNQHGCEDTASVTVQVNSQPVANAGQDKKIMEGESVTLSGSVTGTEVSYYWTPAVAANNSLTPEVKPTSDLTYTLHAVSNVGCGTASDNVFVRVLKKVLIPNAFSPNGDGINDLWMIQALETYPEAVISVYNRYGQQVYMSRGYPRPWNGHHQGKPLPSASYYYVIDLKNDFPVITGWIFIIR
jgi:gliding motility-associated-like protein